MALPKKVSPNPLISSVVELRYVSEISSSKIALVFFKLFSEEFPELEESKIPKELREKEEFIFTPQYTLSNENYSISFSNKVISFQVLGEYKYWDNYFMFICKSLEKIFQEGFVLRITRIGIRYISCFEKVKEDLITNITEVVNNLPSLNVDGYEEKINSYNTTLTKDENSYRILLANNAKVTKKDQTFNGTIIDIDARSEKTIEVSLDYVINKIENLHFEEKKLFFEKILHPDFVNKLDITY